uniref:EGF-like domain-containing protein n=1 Tax=Biomphalaria glabrata TaxID=6526 RepID=A0A2C9LA09_BIOGL
MNASTKCHCANGCETSGECVNGKCAKGWFGFRCQYTKLTAFKIWFIATGKTYKEIPCSGQRLALINEKTLKIFCDLKVLIEQVILEGEAVYFLCSLHVSGECLPGSWGLNCSNKCPRSCPNSCDREYGTCNAICVGSSDPPDCTRACAVTTYGMNCSQSCSDSCLKSYCHPENGSCVSQRVSDLENHLKGSSSADSLSTGIGIGIGASCCLFLIILLIIIIVFKKRKRVTPIPTIRPPRSYDDVDLSTPEDYNYETVHQQDLKKTSSDARDDTTNMSQQKETNINLYVNTNWPATHKD